MTWSVRASWVRGGLISLVLVTIGPRGASAQVEYEFRTSLARGWGEDAVPITEPIVISAPGRYDFELQAGVFGAEGFANYGVANWIGRIHSTEPFLSQPASPRVHPFDSSIGRDGVVSDDETWIGDPTSGYIDAAVGTQGFWYDLLPPPPPAPHGVDELVPLYRFSLTITDMSVRDIALTATTLPNYTFTPIAGWQIFRDIPPDPESGAPGYIEYIPLALPTRLWQPMPVAPAVLRIVPAPAGTALVLMTGLLCVRRRRREIS